MPSWSAEPSLYSTLNPVLMVILISPFVEAVRLNNLLILNLIILNHKYYISLIKILFKIKNK